MNEIVMESSSTIRKHITDADEHRISGSSSSADIIEQETSMTLYINNINDKITINILKKNLYLYFSQYGRVTHIVACKGMKLRGQAWVTFSDQVASAAALSGAQGFNFCGKHLVSALLITYHAYSDITKLPSILINTQSLFALRRE